MELAGTVARRRLYTQQIERLNKVELLNKKEPIPEQYASDIGSRVPSRIRTSCP